ncbi:hypothetical protein Q7O_001957 [Pectobacterium carotovorum subsp. carotovorum PCCS1]|nr:hypothetical protein [Pectobacterium carotovorum subsp. carotovorum PCCS1]
MVVVGKGIGVHGIASNSIAGNRAVDNEGYRQHLKTIPF